jgi:hypothetical protein
MKRSILYIKTALLFLVLSLTGASYSSAQCSNGRLPDPFSPTCKGNPPSVGDLLSNIVPLIPIGIGGLLFGVLLWGAIQVFMSGSSDDGKKKGFQTIQNAITGAALLFLSVGIITLIEAIFGVKILYGFKIV